MYIYRDIYTYSPMLQLHSSYKRTPKRWQPLFVLYAITFSGPLGTDLRCINPCDRSNPSRSDTKHVFHPGRLRRAWQAASPRRFKHRNLPGAESSGDTPGKMMSGKLNQWAPPNLFLELQAPDMVISTNIWYIYIYIYMYVLGGWKYMKWYVYKLIE